MSADRRAGESYSLQAFNSDFFIEAGLPYEKIRREYQHEDTLDEDGLEELSEVMEDFFGNYRPLNRILEQALEDNIHPLDLNTYVIGRPGDTGIY